MAFGIGINCEQTDSGIIRGQLIPIACDCWYTVNGRSIPKMIKLQDEEGEIRTIRNIHTNSFTKKNYSGIPTIEFDCSIYLGESERLQNVKLIFFPSKNCWSMCIPWAEGENSKGDRKNAVE